LRVSLRALTRRQTGLGVASNGAGLSERSDRQLGHHLQSSSRSSTAKAGKTATNIAAAVAALTSTVLMTFSFAPFDIPGPCSFIRRCEKGTDLGNAEMVVGPSHSVPSASVQVSRKDQEASHRDAITPEQVSFLSYRPAHKIGWPGLHFVACIWACVGVAKDQ
jgi:hypothetical protein